MLRSFIGFGIVSVALAVTPAALAQEASPEPVEEEALPPAPPPPAAATLDELLELVREGFQAERAENARREEEFQRAKAEQARLLTEAEATLAREEARSQRLEDTYNANEQELATLEERLTQRLGQLGELFGVVRQVSTDTSGQVWDSLTSSQLGPRKELLDRLGRSKELPSTEDLERLWFELQREMTEQGRVVRYSAPVLTTDGDQVETQVIRAGPFSAIANGKYLLWEPGEQKLRELTRQPPSRYLNTVGPFESGGNGFGRLAVDPSRGSLLNALTDTPSQQERIQQGGAVGYVIISLGLFAVLLGAVRWVSISIVGRKVAAQRKREEPDKGNPLGRVLSIYEENRTADPETLELKLDEAVLRESAKLERFLWLVKVVSVVAPLLGLLGTVTGMIQTFQAITLFGAGDPKMMAGGISEALVTTMLGLTTAIPLVLLHATLANSTRRITDVLDEQSAGLIALRSEQANA
ncbi:MAG: MotA/TolQ/ExbB proton channel family protein [Myxococcota bacterium]|nr:MotA/TolQ/ExbB proton channel family protein [Myxococcota bacterium]